MRFRFILLAVSIGLWSACSDDNASTDTGPDTITETDTGAADSDNDGQTPDAQTPDADATTEDVTPDAAIVDLFPDGLSCPTISLCSTYKADQTRVPVPATSGGDLRDGLYRAEQGSSVPFGFAVSGNNYALIFENLSVSYGTIQIEGDVLRLTQTSVCANGVDTDLPQPYTVDTSVFFADGDELFTLSGCDSLNPDVCGSPTRYTRVNDLCENLDALSCDGSECNCVTFKDVIPERNATCEF